MRNLIMLLLLLLSSRAWSSESIIDIGYEQKELAVNAKIHTMHNVFISSSNSKDADLFGIGYGYEYKEFIGIASYMENGDIELNVSFKPKTILYQMGVTLVKGKETDTDRLQFEYTHFFTRSFGVVAKYDTRRQFFIGVRKWL